MTTEPERVVDGQAIDALVPFLLWTFVLSWGCWGASALLAGERGVGSGALDIAGRFGPSLAAVIVVARARGLPGVRGWLARCLRRPTSIALPTLAFLGPALAMVSALALHRLAGGAPVPSPADGQWAFVPLNFAMVFALGGPLGEELGWRGLMLPRLLAHHRPFASAALVGVAWALWHLPLFLVPGSVQSHLDPLLYALMTVALSIVHAWFFLGSGGSVVVAMVLHTASNAWAWVVPVLPIGRDDSPYPLLVAIAVLIAGLCLLDSHRRSGDGDGR